MRHFGKTSAVAVAISLVCASGAVLVLNYLSEPLFQRLVFNSDALYLPALFTDLFEKAGSIQDWHLTPAPYFFPDFPMYGLAHFLGSDTYDRILVFALLQMAVTFGLLVALCRSLGAGHAGLTAAAILTILTGLAQTGQLPFAYILVSAHHYGIFLVSLAMLALWLRDGQYTAWHDRPRASRWTMLALAYLTTLSDSLFLLQLALPLLLTVWALHPGRVPLRGVWRLPAFPVFVAALAGPATLSVCRAIWSVSEHNSPLGIGPGNFPQFFEILWTSAAAVPGFAALLLAYFALLAIAVKRRRDGHSDTGARAGYYWLALFSGAAMVTMLIGGTVLTDKQMSARYLIAVHSWPVILCVAGLALWMPKYSRLAPVAAALAALCFAGFATDGLVKAKGLSGRYYPAHLACIDEALEAQGGRAGISNYWDAKHAMSFSRLELTLALHLSDLSPDYWITSRAYYLGAYDFALIDENRSGLRKLSAERIVAINGQPEQTVRCNQHTLLLYRRGGLRVSAVE
ncbi:MAG: hypothetical protein GY717_18185 [Rhodobacteraceae bacterium]|nr:hypothetical protein [Paracoccaceae bacterium]